MNIAKYHYKLEISLDPNPHDYPNTPYTWVVWEVDKQSGVQTNYKFGCASTVENACQQALAFYNRSYGHSLTEISGIKDVYVPVYTLEGGATQVGDCYRSKQEADHHAAVVDCVDTSNGIKEVCGFQVEKRRYIPCIK